MKINTIRALGVHLGLGLILEMAFGGEAADIFSDYLKRPKLTRFSRYHTDIRKWLQKLEIPAQADPESILAQLRNQIEKLPPGARHANYEKLLVELTDNSSECRADLVDLVISIYAQLEQAPSQSIVTFLDHFARRKLNQCAIALNAAVEHQPRAEHEIDNFFKLRLQLESNSSDATLLEAIQSSDRKFQLAFYQCSDLRGRFGNMLNILNLALSFGNGQSFHARLLKLNEYSRFCPNQLIVGDY